ncbi:hypothetical protein E8E12_010763 [Didymella heteroderae]|uniref:Uncharacterized protein n=1 Tax=Didymella heteroderae TaxID=1769908 RepID=A0A9P4X0A1_9PLEO|nr:hypothetical protein E8E12_010763 [Didymella heteroderae]
MSIAAIERLPVELLQPIFASSGYNIALVQASAILGARLSSEYVYHNICDHYLKDQCDDFAVRSAAQRAIFASKWMTWSFFKSWLVKTYETKGCLCGLTPEEGCFDAQWPPVFENATSMVFSRSHLPRLAFVRCRIPKKLLGGPWTIDKIQYLQFLLWTTSMTVDWQDPETRQRAFDGKRQAILEKNLGAVELFNNVRRLGRPPTLETVRFAVAEGGCDRSIVYDTLKSAYRWSSSSEVWDYSALYQWCDQRIWDNDNRGVWLRGILQSLRHSELGSYDKSMGRDASFSKIVDAAAEAYSDDFCDQLIRNELPWNKERRQIGWFYWSRHDTQKMGVHRVTRENLGDFWKHRNGHYKTVTGLCRNGRGSFAVRLEMWIPSTETSSAWNV